MNYNLHCNSKRVPGMWYVEDVRDVILIVFVCNAIYVEDVKDRSKMHLRAVMLCMSKMSKMGKEHTDTFLS